MDKGKQRKTDIDVEAEQSRLSEERKRKAKTNEGDERFNKKSKAEEAVESKKFDVTEEELGTEINIAKVKSNKFLQRDFGVKGIGWRIQWRTTWIIRSFNCILDHVIEMNDFGNPFTFHLSLSLYLSAVESCCLRRLDFLSTCHS